MFVIVKEIVNSNMLSKIEAQIHEFPGIYHNDIHVGGKIWIQEELSHRGYVSLALRG